MGKKAIDLLVLHINILTFSFTGIFSKLLAEQINSRGVFYQGNIIFISLIILSCAVYAIFWQQSLKKFDVNVAYSHRAVYNVWSLLWAILIFHEKISIGNIAGTALIILGIVIIQGE